MMQRNLLGLILIMSLLLNGFFLGGYWFAHSKARRLSSEKQRIQAVVEQLGLKRDQGMRFQRLKSKAIAVRRPYLIHMARLRSRLWQALAQGQTSSQEASEIIHEMAIERERYQKKIAKIIQEFLSGLTDEQKKDFLEMVNENKRLSALLSG